MKVFKERYSLYDIEEKLEWEYSGNKKIRIVGDINIDYDDYRFLMDKLRAIQPHVGNLEVMMKYRLSQITSWIFYLRYEDPSRIYISDYHMIMKHIPQHVEKHYLQMYSDAFCEYGFATAAINDLTLQGLFAVVALQAGMSREEYGTLFDIINTKNNLTVPKLYEEKLFDQISYRMGQMFRYLDKDTYCTVIEEICRVYVDTRINKYSVNDVLMNNEKAAYTLVDVFKEKCMELEK